MTILKELSTVSTKHKKADFSNEKPAFISATDLT